MNTFEITGNQGGGRYSGRIDQNSIDGMRVDEGLATIRFTPDVDAVDRYLTSLRANPVPVSSSITEMRWISEGLAHPTHHYVAPINWENRSTATPIRDLRRLEQISAIAASVAPEQIGPAPTPYSAVLLSPQAAPTFSCTEI